MHDICVEETDIEELHTSTYTISLRSKLFTRMDTENPQAQKFWFYKGLVLIVPNNLVEDETDQPGDFDIDVVVSLPAGPVMLYMLRDLLGLTVYSRLTLLHDQAVKYGQLQFQIDDGEHRAIVQQLEDDLANPVS